MKLAYVDRVVDSISPANRATVRKYVDARIAEGLRTTSLMNIAVALRHLDRGRGKRLMALTPDDLSKSLRDYTAGHAAASATSWAAVVRSSYRYQFDDELPRDHARALKRKHRDEWRDVKPITPEERDAVLHAANDTPQRGAAAKRHALVWTLWDSGFRVSEVLALRVGSFEPDDKAGARLRLPPDAPDLKTGPRTIYVVECVGAIKTWLAFHPHRADPSAPLFPSKNDGRQTPWPCNISNILADLSRKAGVRKLNPHLFRHTRATRAAAAGWNEPQLRAFFGWSGVSTMASRYVHLNLRNMEERVRADADVDAMGSRIREDPKLAMAELAAAIVARTMDEVEARRQSAARQRPPRPHVRAAGAPEKRDPSFIKPGPPRQHQLASSSAPDAFPARHER